MVCFTVYTQQSYSYWQHLLTIIDVIKYYIRYYWSGIVNNRWDLGISNLWLWYICCILFQPHTGDIVYFLIPTVCGTKVIIGHCKNDYWSLVIILNLTRLISTINLSHPIKLKYRKWNIMGVHGHGLILGTHALCTFPAPSLWVYCSMQPSL